MKRAIPVAIISALISLAAGAQDADTVLLGYERNFVRSSLGTKADIVREVAARKDPSLVPLFEMAFGFATGNAPLLGPDAQLRELGLALAAASVAQPFAGATEKLWSLFSSSADADLRAAVLRAIGKTASGAASVADNLNAFLAAQNELFRGGKQIEQGATEACVEALGGIGAASSMAPLFAAYIAGYPDPITAKASAALASLHGDYGAFLAKVISSGSAAEKVAAFAAGVSANLPEASRGALAEAALGAALDAASTNPADIQALKSLGQAAVKALTALKWQRASPLVIRDFKLLQSQFAATETGKPDLLDAVACLGVMGSSDAAQVIAVQLQLMNAQTEQGMTEDEDLVMAVVVALGNLGDKVAFDYLLQVGYLPYSDTVKRAARESLLKMRW